MWEIEVKESSMDLVDCPNGHIVIRQRETDELLKHVKMFPKSNDLESREELYQLKKALQKEILKEKVVSNYIKQILLNKVLIDSIVEIEFNPEDYYLHDVIATIIENKFSVKHKNEELKIFLSPPNVTEWAESEDLKFRELVIRAGYNRETLLLPSNIYRQLLEVEGKFKEKYGSEMSKVVLELPINIKAKYVIPKILLIIIDIMEKSGKNINALKKSGLLDLNSWVFEYY